MYFLGSAQIPACTSLSYPQNGDTEIPLSAEIRWEATPNAIRYFLSMGTEPGGTDVLNMEEIESGLLYRPPSGLLPNTTYYLLIIPSNNTGNAINCEEAQFRTGSGGGLPGCVSLLFPEDGDYGVHPGTDISWYPQPEASGYLLSIGTESGLYDILNSVDVGNSTAFEPAMELPLMQRIYIRVVAYDEDGNFSFCNELSFRTRGSQPPLCTDIINPANGAEFVSTTANISWIRNFNAYGYFITIEEKEIGGIRILDRLDIGNRTNYKPPDFMGNTRYFVTITPYNDLGENQTCEPVSFTTGSASEPLSCSRLLMPSDGAREVPVNTALEWQSSPAATGYRLSVGYSPGAGDIVDNLILGNVNTYSFTEELLPNREIFVLLIPFGNRGEAQNCTPEMFTTSGPSISDSLQIPPFFTPNQDGFNDQWSVASVPELQIRWIRIFDRFGKLLRELTEGQSWDGNYESKPLASDSYWYLLETSGGQAITGYILLKR